MASPSPSPSAAPAPAPAPDKQYFLEDDIITVPGQAYALVSFVSPTGNQKCDTCGMKLRGVFGSKQEADSHARKLQRMDPDFDIFLLEMYKWVAVPPDASMVDNAEYQEEFLNELMKGYKKNQLLAKQHFEERKRAVMAEGLDKQLLDEPTARPAHHAGQQDGDIDLPVTADAAAAGSASADPDAAGSSASA